MTYIALKPVTHGKTGELILPPDKVDVSHLTAEQIKVLVDKGVIAKEVKKGQKND